MKRFILILFTVCMTMFFLLPNETQAASTSNYQKLVNYIETYGTSSGGYKTITHTSTYEDFSIQARSGYVLFIGNTVIGSGSLRIAYHMEFQLKESSNTVYISFKYQEGTGSIQSGSTTVNRSTYVRGDKFYSGSSNFASFLNSEFRIICDHWDTHFINNIGFGLKGLGFSKFVGLSGDVCAHTYSNSCDTTCNSCGATRTITHTYSDSLDTQCNVCGEIRTTARLLLYSISGGKVSVKGYNYNSGLLLSQLIIPSTIEGYPVTSIDSSAFSSCSFLNFVTIPDSVTTIGEGAFQNCDGLSSVTIPVSMTTIGNFAFLNCDGLSSVTIPDSVTSIGEYAFFDCDRLTSVTIPDSVTSIGEYAFSCCDSLTGIRVASNNSNYSSDSYGVLFDKNKTTLIQAPGAISAYTIPDSVTSIGGSAFRDCDSMTSVTIPDSVMTISRYAFRGCDSLTGICVDFNNAFYSSDSYGVLFNKHKTYLIQAPTAISGIYKIPDSVTSIGSYAFRNSTGLTSVTIPNSVTSIGEYAFCDCTNLKNVYYTGTANMWEKIYIFGYNDELKNATKHFEVKWVEYCEVQGWFCLECDKVVENFLENPKSCTYAGDCDEYCDVCGIHRETDIVHNFGEDGLCGACGQLDWIKGDFDDNGVIDNKDVEYLLWYTLFPEDYPLPGAGDLDGDGAVTNKDVEYLLWHTLFPEDYPLTAVPGKKKEF